jgi:hypothetical protein
MLEKAVERVKSEIEDFGKSLFHTAVENPYNGISQIGSKVSGYTLPELNITGAPDSGKSYGAMVGAAAGMALDYYILSRLAGPVLGNLGGSGAAGVALRAGLVGSFYTGVLQPSDLASDSFLRDRLANGVVGGITFASLASSAYGLNKSTLFAPLESRSLGGYLTLGALSGASAGAAHAESYALFKEGNLLPSANNFVSDVGMYALIGASAGGFDWAYTRAEALLNAMHDGTVSIKNPMPKDQVLDQTSRQRQASGQQRVDAVDGDRGRS